MYTNAYGQRISFLNGCVNLEKIIFPEDCSLTFENSVLWDKSTGEAFCVAPFHNEKTLVIPDGVKILTACEVENFHYERIEIPATLVEVKSYLYNFPEDERIRIKKLQKQTRNLLKQKNRKLQS